jgi:Transcriptional regulator, AbiEi antitoxin
VLFLVEFEVVLTASDSTGSGWQALAQRQQGLVSRPQALELGLKPSQVRWLLERGTWEVALPGVYRVVGTPIDWMHSLVAASLWAGPKAAISHEAAARLWGFDAFVASESIDLTSRQVLAPPAAITFHRTRKLLRGEVTEHHQTGLTVTTVARTIFDLGHLPAGKHERMLHEALRRNLVRINELEYVLGRNGTRGHEGARDLADWVAECKAQGPTDSDLETDALRTLREARLPTPLRQFRVTRGDSWVAQVDLAWPERRVAAQVHSTTIHRQAHTWEKDQRVENTLAAIGWKVLKATRQNLANGQFVRAVRAALKR